MKYLSTLFILLIVTQVSAQVEITGVVSDEEKQPLEMANIFAVNPVTKGVASFGTTDSQGRYRLNLKNNTTYILKASFVGMETFEQEIRLEEKNLTIPITLKSSNMLDEVNIVHKMPVSVRGDTLVYNADSFSTGKERKLEDVLKKLPGVEVEEGGEIKVQGKKVKKIMVEGKNFFDGNTKLASENIPANAVDKVEVLKNYNEIDQLKSVTDNEDNLAMNIKLKEGKKRFWFGEITAGYGSEKHYLTHPKLFYYSPKYSLNFIGDLNNIGEQPLTWSDYFKFTGGFSNRSKGTTVNLSSGLNALLIPNDKMKSSRTRFGAGQFSYSPSEKWTIDGFAIFYKGITTQESHRETIYLQDTENAKQDETANTINENESKQSLFKLRSSYKPNADNQMDYRILASISKQEYYGKVQSSILENSNTSDHSDDFSLQQSLNYYLTLSEKHIFSFNFEHIWQKENPLYQAILEQFSFAKLLNFQQQNGKYNLEQQQKLKTQKADFNTEYFYVLSPKSNLNFSLGYVNTQQDFNSHLFQTTATQQSVTNDINYTISDYYAGLHYRFLAGNFTFNTGLTLHQYHTENEQEQLLKENLLRLLPDFSVSFKLRSMQNIRLGYAMQTEFTDVKKLAKNYVLSNATRLFIGKPDLEAATYHQLSLNYNDFNSFNFTNIYLGVYYTRKINTVKSRTQIKNLHRIETALNSNLADETYNFNGRFQKSFPNFKWSVRSNLSYDISNNFLQSGSDTELENVRYTSLSQNYATQLRTNIDFPVNFDVGYSFNANRYKQRTTTTNYFTHSPFVSVEWALGKSWFLQSKYTQQFYKRSNKPTDKFKFWGASLRCEVQDTAWEFELSCDNLLKNKTLTQNFGNDYFISNISYRVQPRFFMLQVRYKL